MIQTRDILTLTAPLPLEDGALLAEAKIAYETYGELAGENTVALLHDISASHRALSDPEPALFKPSGWALQLVGSGRIIDTDRDFVVCPNLLGSPFGSTSAASQDGNGKAFGKAFPPITVEDMARSVATLLRNLKVQRLRTVFGMGLGGMVALRMASLFPELCGSVIAAGTSRALPDRLRDQLSMVGQLLRSDPEFKNGEYAPGAGPIKTLKKIRLEQLRRFYPREFLARSHPDQFAVEKRLDSEAEAFAKTFDAQAYASLCTAYGGCDLSPFLEKIKARVLLISSSADEIAPPSRVRETYHLLVAAGVKAHYYELQSDRGHGAFLKEAQRLRAPIREFLSSKK